MKKNVTVTVEVEVEVDESKFDKEFMDEFKEYFYRYDTIDQHIKNLAIQKVQGLIPSDNTFVEGYGDISKMGIKLDDYDYDAEIW